MKKRKALIYVSTIIVSVLFGFSCDSGKKEHNEGDNKEHNESDEKYNQEESKEDASIESGAWLPSGDGEEAINKDFHFIAGTIADISPVVTQGTDGSNLLNLTANGNQTAFVFHKTYFSCGCFKESQNRYKTICK